MDQPVRAADLMAAVSAATDFAKGLPEEQALRTCRIALALAERAGLGVEDRRTTFYLSLLRFIGCTATASEMAAALGDELAVSALFAAVDPRDLRAVLGAAATLVGTERALPARARDLVRFLASAPAVVREHEVASCEVARLFAERVGLPPSVSAALDQVFERFDGRGNPGAARGTDIALPVRVEQVANATELLVRTVGWDAARETLRRRAGSSFDPDLVALACTELPGPAIVDRDLDVPAILAGEPEPWLTYTGEALDRALEAIGAVADLKSVYTRGHAGGVAARASAAARAAGLAETEVALVRRAGWLHDLGRVAVSSRVWDRPGALSAAQWEQVRLHPYITERVLGRCAGLADVAAVAGGHHERVDGSGYHRGVRAERLCALLAAADIYQALGEHRPHRPALPAAERASVLRDEVAAGHLPQWTVDAVLATVGHPARTRAPEVLTVREREVLALVARGATNRVVAQTLRISAKTVNAHLEHIFTKLGVTTRGAASFQAIELGLLDG
jgi:HD-GYP domain-containing protein (c-di-GMP phosphodiesterase class II)